MRIAVVSHSLVADRQAIFWNFFGSRKGVELLQIYPSVWGSLKRDGGVEVTSNEIFNFRFKVEAFKLLRDFRPDLVYIQEEVYSMAASQIVNWVKGLKLDAKIGVFVWDNLHKAKVYLGHPEDFNFIVAGNKEAAEIHKASHIAPQVGLDFDLFYPTDRPREYDVIFASRKELSKGVDIVEKLPFKTRYTQGEPYTELPEIYGTAKVHIILSQDTPYWKEQFLPYSNVEALACGLNCVAAAVKSVREWGEGCPGLTLVPPRTRIVGYNHREQLRGAVASYLADWKLNLEGRDWARARFSKEAVAETLHNIFLQYVS